MYCTTCGNEVPFGDNYCPFDGTFQLHTEHHAVTTAPPKFCSDCGTSNTSDHPYCIQCGSFQLTLIPFKVERVKEKVAAPSHAIPDLSAINKKFAILCGLLAFLVVGIMSFIVSEGFQQQAATFQQTLEEFTEFGPTEVINDFYYYFGNENSELTVEPFYGMTDYWMSAHLLNSTLSFNTQGVGNLLSEEIELHSGMLILLLLPLIALLLAGYMYGRKTTCTLQQYWLSSLLIGMIYGLLTAMIALFAGFNFEASAQEGGIVSSLSIENNYPFLKALFGGLFLGTIFSFIGSLYGSRSMKELTSSPLKEGVRTLTLGISISIVLMILFLYRFMFDDNSLISFQDIPVSYFLIIVFQGGFLLWNTLNLSSLTFDINIPGEKFQMIYSVLGGMKIETNESFSIFTFLFSDPGNTKIYMMIGLLLPLCLFIWAGYRMHQGGAIQFHRMIIFGLLYAFMMSLLAAGLNTGFTFNLESFAGEISDITEVPFLFIGFSAIATFFKCFIYSTLLAICGAYWKRYRTQ